MTSTYMRQALRLARRAIGQTSPNPLVGAVVVDARGRVAGQGYHRRAGAPHAEVEALRQAGAAARGATLYVTLEPCNHHGRTPPCTEAIIRSGVARVVYAMDDPNPEVPGHGAERLRQAGITVEQGDGEAEALALNAPFVTWAQRRRPLITVKTALSLDGRVRTVTGQSKYLTGARAQQASHRLRRIHDAIMVGTTTVLSDDPALTDRAPGRRRDPIRVVLDSHGRIPPGARLFSVESQAPTLVFATEEPSVDWERSLFTAGAEVIRVPADEDGRPDLVEVFAELGRRHVLSVLVDGGPTLVAACVRRRLADRWVSFVAPLYLGGPAPMPQWGVDRLEQAPRLAAATVRRVGDDVMITGTLTYPDG